MANASNTVVEMSINSVQQHAENLSPGWTERALKAIKDMPKNDFLIEEVREFAYQNGLDAPHDDRAWGAVVRLAKKNDLIFHNGYAPAPNAHHRPATLWSRTIRIAKYEVQQNLKVNAA